MLSCFEQSVASDLDREPTSAREDFHDPGRTHTTEERLVGEAGESGTTVAVEHFLPAADLIPIDPWRRSGSFVPQLLEFGMPMAVLTETQEEVALRLYGERRSSRFRIHIMVSGWWRFDGRVGAFRFAGTELVQNIKTFFTQGVIRVLERV